MKARAPRRVTRECGTTRSGHIVVALALRAQRTTTGVRAMARAEAAAHTRADDRMAAKRLDRRRAAKRRTPRPRIASRALSQHAWHPRTASLPLVRPLRCRRLPDRHRAARSHNPMADPSTTTPVVVVRGY